MDKKLIIWSQAPSKASACRYYRIETPLRGLEKLDFADTFIDDGSTPQGLSIAAKFHSDIAHHYALGGEGTLHNFRVMKNMKSAIRDGNPIYPPTIIYDIDDNNDFVHPFNLVAYPHMGVRAYPDVSLLEPGEGLIFKDYAGRVIAKWEDGTTPSGTFQKFDIANNLYKMKIRHEIIREAHGVTVCSPALKRYMSDVIGAKNVYVFPNTIVPEDYPNFDLVRKDNNIRILWQGGHSHFIDWYPLREAVKTISQKYPQVKWVIFGEKFDWISEHIPENMLEYHPWVDYNAYKLKRGLLNIDINLCPLVKNVFNICKSAIKWYEASVWDKPEATLAQNTPPYSEEIVDGKTALLYNTPDEFVEKLSTLIENAELRQRLAQNSKKWVMANRTPGVTIPALYDFYLETRARHRVEIGEPIVRRPTLEEIKKVGTPLR